MSIVNISGIDTIWFYFFEILVNMIQENVKVLRERYAIRNEERSDSSDLEGDL